ncbi:UNVERIFIED_CONTAM: hypothetical protein Scaly_1641800 [Sesamum calycinum]|uniref:YtxH domain-containing protein n=1 Tax=Sesamum calycinum TaxID=2727403 RepID=A0AAW2PAF6_9LAMI
MLDCIKVFIVLEVQKDRCAGPTNLAFAFNCKRKSSTQRKTLIVQASYSDSGRPSSASIFVGGFILGGLIVGTLGCVYAPQKQRKKLAEKIDQLNAAIDNVSSQLRSEDPPSEGAVSADDIEAVV